MKSPRRLVRLHCWIGWVLALPLLTIAGSGVVLGFYDDLRYAAAPYRLGGAVRDALPPHRLAEAVRRALPRFHLKTLYLPAAPEHSARAQLEGARTLTAFVHPGTGAILSVRAATRKDWLDVLYEVHHGKLFHLPGQILASASGLGVTLLWLMGLLAWRRRPARGDPRAGLTTRMRLGRVHRSAGVLLAGPVAVLAFAGALLNFAAPLKQWLDPPPVIGTARDHTEPVARLEQIVAVARGAYPSALLQRIYFPRGHERLMRLRFQDGGWVDMDARSGEVLKVSSPYAHWSGLLYPLHSGRLFGPHGPRAIAAGGVVLLVLIVSGLGLSVFRPRAFRQADRVR